MNTIVMSLKNLLLFLLVFLHLPNLIADPSTFPDSSLLPDYSKEENWASLPSKKDSADLVPYLSPLKNEQSTAKVDVFFVHPTTLTMGTDKRWNADIDDGKLNKKTDRTAIKHQASVFNGSCRIFAPRYRQAHYRSYRLYKKDSQAKEALELAYTDVKAAFEYYLTHYNEGRPIIIASHSQGSTHTIRLLKEYFEGQENKKKRILQDQLVAAYLIGMPVKETDFEELKPCQQAEETGCYNTWNAWEWGHEAPKDRQAFIEGAIVTNPITWTIDETPCKKEVSKGVVLRKFDTTHPGLIEAKAEDGFLWVKKPDVPGKIFILTHNYHFADYNLFWLDIRQNVDLRVQEYLSDL